MGTEPSISPDGENRRCSSCGGEMEARGREKDEIVDICDSCLEAETIVTPLPAQGEKRGESKIRSLLSLALEESDASTTEDEPTVAWDSSLDETRVTATEASPLPRDGKIGKFEIIERIGTGGFGDVYRARQYDPVEREVALKVLKPGMSSREIVRRFEAERQTLAMMEHPNIARVIDGGETPSGNPYFVMELVRGEPVTSYCDRKKLGVRDRLAIFQQICAGVQHAHQKGIIHRDLKPSNILVEESDGKPLPKVIDFGVSKALVGGLAENTAFTQAGQAIGTPQYMSPEQAIIDEHGVDTRSDIFSLGVILYELLTGETPITSREFQKAGMLAMADLIHDKTPPRPSTRIGSVMDSETVTKARRTNTTTLRKTMRQDLDWIVMKALEKERERRYGSAAAFAEDLKRYLSHQPVMASPPSRVYALKKFARRQRGPLIAGGLVLMAIVLGAVISVWQAMRAMEESERARMAERESALQRDAANAVNLIETEPLRALEIMDRVTDESELLFGRLSVPVTNALVEVVDAARETARMTADTAISADTRREESLTAVITERTCFLFDLKKGSLRTKLAVGSSGDNARSVGLFPNGERVAVGYESGEMAVFSTVTGGEMHRWNPGKGNAIEELVVSKSGDRITVLDAGGSLSRWSADGKVIGVPVQTDRAAIPDFLACDEKNNLTIVSGLFAESPYFSLVDFSSENPEPRMVETPGKTASALAVRGDGERFLTGFQDGTIQIWNREGFPVGSPILAHRATVWQVAFVEGTDWVVSAGANGEVRVWGEGGEAMSPPLAGVAGEVAGLSSLANGQFLTAVFRYGEVIVWDNLGLQARPGIPLDSVAEELTFPSSRPDELVAALADGRVVAIDWKKSGKILREARISEGAVLRIRTNQSGKLLAMTVRSSPDLHLVDFPDFTSVRKIRTESGSLLGVEFSGDDDELILCYGDGGELFAINPVSQVVEEVANIGNSSDANCNLIRLRNPLGPYTHLFTGINELKRARVFNAKGEWSYGTPRGISAPVGIETSNGIAFVAQDSLRIGIASNSEYQFPENQRAKIIASGIKVEQLAYAEKSDLIAAGTTNGMLRLFDGNGTALSPLIRAHRIGVESVTHHPTEPLFITGGHDGWIRFWGSHEELWKRSLQERIRPTLPDSTFSMDSFLSKETKGDAPAAAWDSAIFVKDAGLSIKAHPDWKKSNPATVVGINQLIVKGLGEHFKRMRLASVHYHDKKDASYTFLQDDAVIVFEIPEFVHPYAFANRLPKLTTFLYQSINNRLTSVLSMEDDGISMVWDDELQCAIIKAELKYTSNRKGVAFGFWIPSHGSTAILGTLMSYDTEEEDSDGQVNPELEESAFLDGVREQVKQAVIHESHRLSEEEIAEVKLQIENGGVELAATLMRGQFRGIDAILAKFESVKIPQPRNALRLIEDYIAGAELGSEKAKSATSAMLWRRKIVDGKVKKSQSLRRLGRVQEALISIGEALAMVEPSPDNGVYSGSRHCAVLRELYYSYRTAGDEKSTRRTVDKLVELSREISAKSMQLSDAKVLADDLNRLSEELIRNPSDWPQAEKSIQESLGIADELRSNPLHAEEGMSLAVSAKVRLSTLERKRENYGPAITLLTETIEHLEALREIRPDSEHFQRKMAKNFRDLALDYILDGDEAQSTAAFGEYLEETDRWIRKFGKINKHLNHGSIGELIGRRDLFNELARTNKHSLYASLQQKQITMIRSWPDAIRESQFVAPIFASLLRDTSRCLADHLGESNAVCFPLIDEARSVCLDFLDDDDPSIRKRFLTLYFQIIREKNWIHDHAAKDPDFPWGQQEIKDWLAEGAQRIPEKSALDKKEDLALIDQIAMALSAYAWKTMDVEGHEAGHPIVEEAVAWRKHQLAIDPSRKASRRELAQTRRMKLQFLDKMGKPMSVLQEEIDSIDNTFTKLLSEPNPNHLTLSQACDFHKICFPIYRDRGDLRKAAAASRKALGLFRLRLESSPEDLAIRGQMADYQYHLATCLINQNKQEALKSAENSVRLFTELFSESKEMEERFKENKERAEKFLGQ